MGGAGVGVREVKGPESPDAESCNCLIAGSDGIRPIVGDEGVHVVK